MRREQIFKICLNHALTADIEYKVKDDKSWHFVANDFSEGEMELLQFCLRFKTADIANGFKEAIDAALANTTATPQVANTTTTTNNETTTPSKTESEKPSQSNISDEEKELSATLHLPVEFFGYKQAAPCSGCRGCNSDDFKFAEVKDINFAATIDANPLPLTQPKTMKKKPSRKDNIVKQSSFSFAAVCSPTTKSSSEGTNSAAAAAPPKNIFANIPAATTTGGGGGNLFSQSVFGGVGSSSPATAPKLIFGNSGGNTPIAPSVFGGASIFSSKPIESKSAAASSFTFALSDPSTETSAAAATTTTKSYSFGAAPIFGQPKENATTAAPSLFGSVEPKQLFATPKNDNDDNATTASLFSGISSFGSKRSIYTIFKCEIENVYKFVFFFYFSRLYIVTV